MNEMKPIFSIDLRKKAQSPLECLRYLYLVNNDENYYRSQNVRPPLGTYNTSINRICQKVERFCLALVAYIQSEDKSGGQHSREVLVDAIELAIYSAAEHVSDIKLIAGSFYQSNSDAKKCKDNKLLLNEVERHKRFVSAMANAIKHTQSRIRLYGIECIHGGIPMKLHGYFIERVENGVIGPSVVFHNTQGKVFSISSLAWEILIFLLLCSRSLKKFLLTKNLISGPVDGPDEYFRRAAASAIALPLFSFDEDHPFSKVTICIASENGGEKIAGNSIYGSIANRWNTACSMQFGDQEWGFQGDSVSTEFSIGYPNKVNLQHWT